MEEPEETCCGLKRDDWGWFMLGAGAVSTFAILLRRERWVADWLLPLGLAGSGLALLFQERAQTVDAAEQRVVTELEALDAIARAQVIKRVATRELGFGRDDEPDTTDED